MKNKWSTDIEIGTRFGISCSDDIKKWFDAEISQYIRNYQTDKVFPGDPSKCVHRLGDKASDPSYVGYGDNFNTFQIEISKALRENHVNQLVDVFSGIILGFNRQFK